MPDPAIQSSTPWRSQVGYADYVLTDDRTAIAQFATVNKARAAGGRPVVIGCMVCSKHPDEFHGCDCADRLEEAPGMRAARVGS